MDHVNYIDNITHIQASNKTKHHTSKQSKTKLAEEERERVTEILNEESSALRHELSRTLNLRHTPEIEFRYDFSIERGVRLSQLIDDQSISSHTGVNVDE